MPTRFIPSAAAAARLGVKRASLYAYVSRGLLTAHSLPGHRGSWFDPVELDTLTTRAREPIERRPDLRVTSAVTLLEQGRYWYRGRAPEVLARERSFESVAEWLWTSIDTPTSPRWTTDDDDVRRARAALAALPKTASPAEQARLAITILGATDPLRTDLRPAGALATARRLVANAAKALGGRRDGRVAEQVAAWVGVKGATPSVTRAIEQALVIMADHELAASTLAVRVSASFGADPYAAVVAGLGPVSGARNGAASRRIELCLNAIARGERAPHAAARLLGGDDSVPGFGHPLYPAGDPRVDMLLPVARSFGTLRAAESLHRVATEQGAAAPNVDFALAALTHRLGLRVGAGEAIFTMGRLAGWLAHAIEEYTNRTAFRLRAVYTGPRPEV